jgi:hypothetical protein
VEGNVLSGIHDIDVWLFFRKDENIDIPNINNCLKENEIFLDDIGNLKVHFMKKAIKDKVISLSEDESITSMIMSYINHAKTDTSNLLSEKSIIGLYPESIFKIPIYRCCRKLESFNKGTL